MRRAIEQLHGRAGAAAASQRAAICAAAAASIRDAAWLATAASIMSKPPAIRCVHRVAAVSQAGRDVQAGFDPRGATCNAASPLNAAATCARAGGRAGSAAPGSQGVSSQSRPWNSWTERSALSSERNGRQAGARREEEPAMDSLELSSARPSGGPERRDELAGCGPENARRRARCIRRRRPATRARETGWRSGGYRASSSIKLGKGQFRSSTEAIADLLNHRGECLRLQAPGARP